MKSSPHSVQRNTMRCLPPPLDDAAKMPSAQVVVRIDATREALERNTAGLGVGNQATECNWCVARRTRRCRGSSARKDSIAAWRRAGRTGKTKLRQNAQRGKWNVAVAARFLSGQRPVCSLVTRRSCAAQSCQSRGAAQVSGVTASCRGRKAVLCWSSAAPGLYAALHVRAPRSQLGSHRLHSRQHPQGSCALP